tara:strand:+ start:21441 stop:21866 length:426 start_codon:yes stop_codon:yes gene_type:complete
MQALLGNIVCHECGNPAEISEHEKETAAIALINMGAGSYKLGLGSQVVYVVDDEFGNPAMSEGTFVCTHDNAFIFATAYGEMDRVDASRMVSITLAEEDFNKCLNEITTVLSSYLTEAPIDSITDLARGMIQDKIEFRRTL